MHLTATTLHALALSLAPAGDTASTVARMPDAARLSAFHELLASEPHVAGTAGDARTIERISEAFRTMGAGLDGWEVRVEELFPLLSRPVKGRLEIVAGRELPAAAPNSARRGVLALRTDEPNLAVDPATAHPDLDIAWNAWSGSGLVEAGVVYVNYGRREDFAKLAELGVDPRGKIALARYGGNFRGYKARFAQEAGCVGLVIFTDPADSGFTKGKTWPEGGGWANAECIQRGSLGTLPYVGDPLTPGRYASKDAARLDPAVVELPRIPVQPIGYGAAQEILRRMKGAPAPKEWCGGLPLDYTILDAEDSLRLRLEVEQRREVTRTANVFARLRGATRPDEEVHVGAHHDAWCFGAADPLAGTICMLESARDFAELARQGIRLDRTLVFCAWGAEEYGIIGSSEFVERDAAQLTARSVAYINLDMAAMGLRPGAGVSPTLRGAVARALAKAPGPKGEGTALDAWSKSAAGVPSFGDLGGGSDHVGFWCHAGVPSVSLSTSGGEGTSYHSNYDTVAWYRATVGADYAAAQLVTGLTNAMLAEFADAREPEVALAPLVEDSCEKARALVALAKERGLAPQDLAVLESVATAFDACRLDASAADVRIARAPREGDEAALARVRTLWVSPSGLEGRAWFRNLYAATDRYSGYGTSAWPLLREALEDARPGDEASLARVRSAAGAYLAIAAELRATLAPLAR
jgi:N-acetylated-alpha-linked acidic dipeptidase